MLPDKWAAALPSKSSGIRASSPSPSSFTARVRRSLPKLPSLAHSACSPLRRLRHLRSPESGCPRRSAVHNNADPVQTTGHFVDVAGLGHSSFPSLQAASSLSNKRRRSYDGLITMCEPTYPLVVLHILLAVSYCSREDFDPHVGLCADLGRNPQTSCYFIRGARSALTAHRAPKMAKYNTRRIKRGGGAMKRLRARARGGKKSLAGNKTNQEYVSERASGLVRGEQRCRVAERGKITTREGGQPKQEDAGGEGGGGGDADAEADAKW